MKKLELYSSISQMTEEKMKLKEQIEVYLKTEKTAREELTLIEMEIKTKKSEL